ncbi:MAG: PTS sugar transporter subunit IIC [Clostridia bacterium]|nr:PTS sugar transporter subunit IIC [Clostridia bacterium]
MSYMALGLFSSLIIGLIIGQIAKIPYLDFLTDISDMLSASSPVVGAAIGAAIGYSLHKDKPLVVFSSAVAGAVGYSAGGPVGAYLAAVVGAEIGGLLSGKTKIDIIITPLTTIIPGGLVGLLVGPYINQFMQWLGSIINSATELAPIPMGIAVSVIVGLALTAPISSAALCIMIGLDGIAAGAACVGCCCQMMGFAVASFRDNGFGGLISQGIGTSMLQFGNILNHPQIWLAPTLASAILGPISAALLGMTNTSSGAGMGTSGFVGQFGAFSAMNDSFGTVLTLVYILLMHFILPAVLTFVFDLIFRKIGWVKKGYMKIQY